ncbi:O-acyltransferase like protein [Fragariocoptes setiger]|uniref:O-acyltransferase like protein n=1 Tax=Fragariocoptes setiger TaxID=1670756 RepID=A0ABQ7SA51_9ACAR|nr:O-acyltransferase like protein [Fragariocoptes setiger]
MGLAIGYWLRTRPTYRVPKRIQWLLWLTLPPVSFGTLLMTYLWNGAYSSPSMIDPSPSISALYVACHRTLWTALVAWVVFACATGCASHVNVLLSSQVFVPLSRLSYSIYLVHLPVIMFRSLNIRHTLEWNDINMLWEASGNLVASVLVAYLVNILFESPILNLEKHFRQSSIGNTNRDKHECDTSSTKESTHCVVIDSIEKSNRHNNTDSVTTKSSDNNSFRDDTHSSGSDNSELSNAGQQQQEGELIGHTRNSIPARKVAPVNELALSTTTTTTTATINKPSSINDHQTTTTSMLYKGMNDRMVPEVVLRRAWQDLERVTNAYGTLQRRRGGRHDNHHNNQHLYLDQHQQERATLRNNSMTSRNEEAAGQSMPRHYYDTYSYRIDGRTPLSSFVELSTAYDRALQANHKHWPNQANVLIPRVTGTLQRNSKNNSNRLQQYNIEDEDES